LTCTDAFLGTYRLFDGRTVIVTGSARGLGRDYVQYFAADGANVVVADINVAGAEKTAAEIRDKGGEAHAVALDVSDPASAEAMVAATVAKFGGVDILVNNAGLWGDYELVGVSFVDFEYWNRVLAVNLTGPLICARAVLPIMEEAEWGRIVNISSIGANMAMSGAYGVSKAGLNALTFQLAHEVGYANITVNSLVPGTVKNEATLKQIPEEMADVLVEQQNIIKRPGTGADMYGALRWLCSNDAEWVTAQWISPNGGAMSRL
jgi:NAD(P)-dependent dehydrogenase (short-subunit alcohol dehydrogenase family)